MKFKEYLSERLQPSGKRLVDRPEIVRYLVNKGAQINEPIFVPEDAQEQAIKNNLELALKNIINLDPKLRAKYSK